MSLTVNGETIDAGLVDAEFSRIKAHFEQQANVSCCERDDEFLGYAKENLVARVLLTQEASAATDSPAEEDINARLEELKQEYGGEESFYFSLGIAPGDEDRVRAEIASGLAVDRLVEKIAGEPPEPDEEELKAYYQEHAREFESTEEVRALHIFKSLREAEHREDLFNELRELRQRARAGEDFMELVRKHSDKPEDEADLGFYKRGELMEEFELITFSMETGEISPVFATQWGMHLAKVTERKAPQAIPFEEVREDIIGRLSAEHREAKLNAHVETLKAKAEICDEVEEEVEEEP